MIRAKLFKGLKNGTMAMRSLYDDERMKMSAPQACYYCGSTTKLTMDHMIPRMRGGADESDNLIWACRSCNSSKGGCDLLEWMKKKDSFPPILLLRRYMKLVARYCDEHGILEMTVPDALQQDLPFDLSLLPYTFPPVSDLRIWAYPEELAESRHQRDDESETEKI